ncbi:hypothetical protein DMB66_23020 [Actinoplanes sp. ATCC 53533]|uniref:hypothetical protein n=1 Tax=Actinoplanes sp. ATCC 53533 TaxID=1288362 RepID=UPI000F7A91F6|nr:hypothetical protein [Actinoplanes sp. ATCC 53533]RSM62035.1 hypothetical protein DMB66_23020 [Actinoplanes sp. ATCC 53533]
MDAGRVGEIAEAEPVGLLLQVLPDEGDLAGVLRVVGDDGLHTAAALIHTAADEIEAGRLDAGTAPDPLIATLHAALRTPTE